MEWNEKLKQARKKAGLSQEDVASAIGKSRSTYANYELARRKPTFLELKQIARVLHLDVNYLVEGEEVSLDVELMSRATDVFNSLNISEADKDAIFQDVMKIYLKGKEEIARIKSDIKEKS